MTRTIAGLAASDEQAMTILKRIKVGEAVKVDVVRPRNIRNHRRYWALVNLIYENTEMSSPEVVHNTLKALGGHAEPIVFKDTGQIVLVPLSTSFSAMDEDEFQDFWQRVVKATCEKLLPSVTEVEIENQILQLIGGSTWAA